MKIMTNSAVTLDGRIAEGVNRFEPPGSPEDHRHMSVLRNRADAVLVGGNSFRCTPLPLLPRPEHLEVPLRPLPYWNVVMSRTLDIPISERYFSEPAIKRLFLTSAGCQRSDIPGEVVRAPGGDPTPRWVVSELEARGVQILLIEGGGDLIYQFLAADLVDELHLTLCPRVIGRRGAPSLADGDLPLGDPFKTFRLQEARVVGDEVFLTYGRR